MDSKVESGNPDAKRLYDDLLSNYNKLVRPVANISETVTVHLKLKLSQLIAVVREHYYYIDNAQYVLGSSPGLTVVTHEVMSLDWIKASNLFD